MGTLRRKIHAIRELSVSSEEKARMVHELMTENYHSSRAGSDRRLTSTPPVSDLHVSAAPKSQEIREGRSSVCQPSATSPPIDSSIQEIDSFNLTPEDIEPTFAPKDDPDSPLGDGDDDDDVVDVEELEEASLGCKHYKRNVKIECYVCKKWYTCRFCHDQVEDHHLVRQKTEHMLCMFCGHAQPASQWCRKCGEQAALYYCNICKLWDNDSNKSIYHCNDCGICRIGQGLGKDFFHCKVKTADRC